MPGLTFEISCDASVEFTVLLHRETEVVVVFYSLNHRAGAHFKGTAKVVNLEFRRVCRMFFREGLDFSLISSLRRAQTASESMKLMLEELTRAQ